MSNSKIKSLLKSDNNKNSDEDDIQMEEDSDDSFHPWIKPDSKCHINNGMLKLHYEILDFCKFVELNDEEKNMREKTYNSIKEIIESKFPEYKCILYGSFKTGLSLPDSDIDILILQKEKNDDTLKVKLIDDIIKKIQETLYATKLFSYLEIIKAKVPIIKCTYKETGINVDISFFRKNGASAVKEIKNIIEKIPEIKPLMIVIKYTLRQRQLNEIYKGGVSSVIIFSLLFYYISDTRKKIIHDAKNGKKEAEMTLGHLLVGFFDFYGFNFNYEKLGISIRNGCFLYERDDDGKNLLSVENFQDISQDMGKSCFKFRKVIDTFKFARDSLFYPEKSPIVSFLSGFIFPDEILKKRADDDDIY